MPDRIEVEVGLRIVPEPYRGPVLTRPEIVVTVDREVVLTVIGETVVMFPGQTLTLRPV